jgi:hypothetical protein
MMLNGIPQAISGVAQPVPAQGLLGATTTTSTDKEEILRAMLAHPLFQGLLAQQQYQNYGPGALAANWNNIQGGADNGGGGVAAP